MAGICVDTALSRHVGKLESVYTVMGMMYYQNGKDLSNTTYVIGTGGVLIKAPHPKKILQYALINKESLNELRPNKPSYLVDYDYILSAMGLLSTIDPFIALKIMKKHIRPTEV